MIEKQQIEISIYPPYSRGVLWQTTGYVFGHWAVHKRHPDEHGVPSIYRWHITHMPSGVRGFVAKSKIQAIQAAKRLAGIVPPKIVIEQDDEWYRPAVKPVDIGWICASAAALQGLEVWGVTDFTLLRPDEIVPHVMAQRNIIAFD